MGALDTIVRSGRALYAGISSYTAEQTRDAVRILDDLGTPCLIHQPGYSMLNRWIERDGLKETLADLGVGSIVFSPLAQGLLTARYLDGIPADSRAAQAGFLKPAMINDGSVAALRGLAAIAAERGQTLAQMALAWVLRAGGITLALIGASRPEQVTECVGALANLEFSADELRRIDALADEASSFRPTRSLRMQGLRKL